MIQKADTTSQNPTDAPLSPQKEKALAALLAGRTVTDAAKAARVARCTVHAWLKDDFDFQAALFNGRREQRAALKARLLALGDKALAALERAIEGGDARIALEVVKGLNVLGGPTTGPDDPAKLRRERERYDRAMQYLQADEERRFPFGTYCANDPLGGEGG